MAAQARRLTAGREMNAKAGDACGDRAFSRLMRRRGCMLSLKQNVLETMKNGRPDAFVNE